MKTGLWGVLGVAALLWSGLAMLFHWVAQAPGAAVVSITRWFELDPGSTQWLADTLALAGGLAQGLVIAVWLIGMAAIAGLGWLGSRAVDDAERAVRQFESAQRRNGGAGPVIDATAHEKAMSKTSGTIRKD